MQKELKHSPRSLSSNPGIKEQSFSLEAGAYGDCNKNTNPENTSLNPLKRLPGVSFSMMYRFLLVSRICRRRMALFCRKNYGLETNLFLILLAASEGHLQQGILARGLGINKNAMVFLIDRLELRRLLKRVPNPDNRRERLIECTLKGRQIVTEVKSNYPALASWGLYPLTPPQIEQFGTLLAQIIDGEASAQPPMPLLHPKKKKKSSTTPDGPKARLVPAE